MKTLSLVSYPTSTIWVDDARLFLQTAKQLLKDKVSLLTFSDPRQFLNYIKGRSPILAKTDFLRGATEIESYDISDHMPVDINLEALKVLRKKERSNEVSVLIVAYYMPEINGIGICYEFSGLPMKKILITGEANFKKTVIAFNEGLIDCFIRKDSPTFSDDVYFYLNTLTLQYFIDSLMSLSTQLETDYLLPTSDPEFIAFFNEWCRTHHIREHYLFDKNRNILLIYKKDEVFYFSIHTQRTLDIFVELYENTADVSLFTNAVKKKELVPSFYEGVESWQLQYSQWKNFFYASQRLKGREKYYWFVCRRQMNASSANVINLIHPPKLEVAT